MGTYATGGFSPVDKWLKPRAVRAFICFFHLIDRYPVALRTLFACFRLKPVWRLGRTVLVTRDGPVSDALRRDDDFPLPEKRAAKFLTGPFVLGMTRTPQFALERAVLEDVLPVQDASWVRQLAAAESATALAVIAGQERLDVVKDLSTPVGKCLIRHYFGVNDYPDDGPELIDDLRKLGAMVASPHSELQEFQRQAEAAAMRVYDHIDAELSRAGASVASGMVAIGHDTVLLRLVSRHLQGTLDHDAVRRNITGVLLPGTALVNRAFATSLVQILKRKPLRRMAEAAAIIDDYDTLNACLLEAMRFHPVFPVLPRYCSHETALRAFKGQYRLRAGRDVFVAVASAMFDPQGALFAGPDGGYPSEVQLRDRAHYRHFGGGMHRCLGPHIALAQMSAMLGELLKFGHVKLAKRRLQPISYGDDGISPKSLELTFTVRGVPVVLPPPPPAVVSGIPHIGARPPSP